MDKSPEAFRTISEVAEDLDLPQHVLRFWETRFAQIKPLKRGGGRRYYRPDDVDLLKGIRYYLYGEGYTIKGVQRILKERGLKHVCEMGRAQTENFAPPVATIPRVESEEERRRRQEDWPEAELPGRKADGTVRQEPLFDQAPLFDDGGFEEDEAAAFEAPSAAAPPASRAAPTGQVAPAASRSVTPPPSEPARSPAPPPATPAPPAPLPPYAVGRETGRRLQTALFELLECKRILDATR